MTEVKTTSEDRSVSGLFEPTIIDPRRRDVFLGRFPKGHGGFLRSPSSGFAEARGDVRISSEVCRKYKLRGGEFIEGATERIPIRGPEARARVEEVRKVNGRSIADHMKVTSFEELTRVDPYQQVRVETDGGPISMRVIDLMVPLGFGQRSAIIAPPGCGKTILLQQLAHGIAANYESVEIFLLLIDERPEDVTDMRRQVPGEVIASPCDRDAGEHVRLVNLMFERAKRMVERGKDVFIILDSMTRLTRAFLALSPGGLVETPERGDALDSSALLAAQAIWSSAKNVDEGGSLTLLASFLTDTGSEVDEQICRQFLGKGNAEIWLSKDLASKRIWPAIDLSRSATIGEDLLVSSEAIQSSTGFRKQFEGETPDKCMTILLEKLREYETNEDLVLALD